MSTSNNRNDPQQLGSEALEAYYSSARKEAPTTPDGTSQARQQSHNPRTGACLSALPSDEAEEAETPSTSIFFARAPSTMPYEDLHVLFSQFGSVQHLNLFKRWPKAKTSKGCGTVQYSSVQEASTALSTLNGVHSFGDYPGCEGPMVVEWVDASRISTAMHNEKVKCKSAWLSSSSQSRRRSWPTAAGSSSNQHALQHLPTCCGSAAPAAATATACCDPFLHSFGSVPPVLDLDVSSLLPCSVDEGLGVLGGTTEGWAGVTHNWAADIPVHALLMMINQLNVGLGGSSPPTLSALVSSAASAAEAAGTSAAAAVSAQVSASSSGLGLLPLPMSGPVGYPNPTGLQASWMLAGPQQMANGSTPIGSTVLFAALPQQQQDVAGTPLSSSSCRSDLGTAAVPTLAWNLQGRAPVAPAAPAAAAVQHSLGTVVGNSSTIAAAPHILGAAACKLEQQQ